MTSNDYFKEEYKMDLEEALRKVLNKEVDSNEFIESDEFFEYMVKNGYTWKDLEK